ncbi:MAG: sterol desaturase family protein [Sphingobium sp.]|nr:sterol desaturase family protein [Sphingobium sp.]
MKQKFFNLVPPLMLLLVILFWAIAPAAWVKSGWTVVLVSTLIMLTVLGLEFVAERHANWRINWREFFTDMGYVIFSATAIAWVTATLADDPLKSVKTSLGITTHWAEHLPFLAQVALVVFLVEFGQYWMHRLMHNWTPFWLIHAPHHHITQLNAMKGAVGNPVELFLISLTAVALFDLSPAATFCAFNCLTVISTFAHANVRADPPIWYSFFFTTIRHHSLHHSVPYEDTRYNYGNSLILLDRIFGTYREGEANVVGQGDRKRLSIWEQTIFPVVPVIDWIRARRASSASVSG